MAPEPVHEVGRFAREFAVLGRTSIRIHIATEIGARREHDSPDTHKVADPIHIGLRIRAQSIIYGGQDVLAAEALEPCLETRRVAVGATQMRQRFEGLVEGSATHPSVMTLELVRSEEHTSELQSPMYL